MEVQFRDAYGFAVRPQHLQRYREYANIYKEEEEERSYRWETFFKSREESEDMDFTTDKEDMEAEDVKKGDSPIWDHLRPLLRGIERIMSDRIKKRSNVSSNEVDARENSSSVVSPEVSTPSEGSFEEPEDESCTVEIRDATGGKHLDVNVGSQEANEEFESLVHGGLPMALRGELWQAFVGVNRRRVEGYYCNLLASETNKLSNEESVDPLLSGTSELPVCRPKSAPEKWKTQIEKDLPRTFPGHPALDDDGRDALRRILTAYAWHNPSVGYCQAMNFFAGLLLLLMPEENAFWTLLGVIDDYFEGYYTEEMIDSQVDQLVFEDLMREKFPKLANHLDYLGVNVAWVTGPWFLSIFINMLPWESVLRVWDVLLFDGNRAMLFRTALALMELYGPALLTTKDAGDAVTLLQSLAGSTFDGSQLVLTACMGYQVVNESKLQELRKKHRSPVITAMKEKFQDSTSTSPHNLAKKLYSFKHDPGALMAGRDLMEVQGNMDSSGHGNLKNILPVDIDFGMAGSKEVDSVSDLKEQVMWLKVELCRILEDKRSAIQRAEELETALMEMVKQDNRRILSVKVEQLEKEVAQLQKTLLDKQEQENATIQILMRMEQDHKATEDARVSAELDAAAQRYAVQMLQEKYEEAVFLLTEMEKRAVMAETMLEATLQYQSIQVQVQATSPRTARKGQESFQREASGENSLLHLELGLRDRSMEKSNDMEEYNEESTTDMSPKHNLEPEKRDLNMS